MPPTLPAIPPLLSSYLTLPATQQQPPRLILLTSVLGASTNWLLLRFLHSALASPTPATNTKVIMLSFLRDRVFWVDGAKKLGLDLEKEARWVFLDGLCGRDGVAGLKRELLGGLGKGEGRVLVVVDGVDWLVASAPPSSEAIVVQDILDDIFPSSASGDDGAATTILTLSSLPRPQTPETPLECAHTALLTTLAHRADYVMGLRLLETGVARDCSGVLRVTVGGDGGVEEGEVVYWVGGGGEVRVWERGSRG
ncbi:hypothetical protein FGG08_001973 [Glutinoglossum americanum]|uniref:Uncharacterized protein n=1 Tax=Glutinoglossum americanum TaxID=1670608 RepID=A0A9P8IDV7_9PEZI|nr:hypothetical protein FGG08_001973 [Glutinoglossum americanum]